MKDEPVEYAVVRVMVRKRLGACECIPIDAEGKPLFADFTHAGHALSKRKTPMLPQSFYAERRHLGFIPADAPLFSGAGR